MKRKVIAIVSVVIIAAASFAFAMRDNQSAQDCSPKDCPEASGCCAGH